MCIDKRKQQKQDFKSVKTKVITSSIAKHESEGAVKPGMKPIMVVTMMFNAVNP